MYYTISALLNFLFSLSIGLIFIIRTPKKFAFPLFNFGIAFWSFFYFLWQNTADPLDALRFCQFLMMGAAFIPAFFWNFAVDYTQKKPSVILNLITLFNIGWAIFFCVMTRSPLFIHAIEPAGDFLLWPKAGPLFYLFLAFFLGNVIASHLLLYQKYRRFNHKNDRIIFIGTLIAFVGGSTNFFLWIDIPIPPIGNIFISVYALFISYVIVTKGLFSLRVMTTSVVTRAIAVLMIAVGYGTGFVLISYYEHWIAAPYTWIIKAFLLLSVGEMYNWIHAVIKAKLTPLFVNANQFHQRLSNWELGIHRSEDVSRLIAVLAAEIQLFSLDIRLVWFPKHLTGAWTLETPWVDLQSDAAEISMGDRLSVHRVQDIIFQENADDELETWMNHKRVGVVIPLLTIENDKSTQIGIIGIADRTAGYTYQDSKIFELIQTAVPLALKGLREEANRRAAALEAQRIRAMKPLVVGVLHEICSPLAAAKMGVDTLNRFIPNLPVDAEIQSTLMKIVTPIKTAIERIETIISRLREFEILPEGDYVGGERMMIFDIEKWGDSRPNFRT